MRRFKNLDCRTDSDLKDFQALFKRIESGTATPVSISVFDHSLSEDEANTLLVNVAAIEQARRDACHADFCSKLAERYKIFNITFKGRKKCQLLFREFTSKDVLKNYFRPQPTHVNSRKFFNVIIPELGAFYVESWDDTNHIYYIDKEKIEPMLSLARECGLFVLD